jgi:hypothetical protein
LLARSDETFWPDAFAAYMRGWAEVDVDAAETALDHLVGTQPALWQGVLRATCGLMPSQRSTERLLRLLATGSAPRSQVARETARFIPWRALDLEATERLIDPVDDETPEARAYLVEALTERVLGVQKGALPEALQERAWRFLRSSYPVLGQPGRVL